MWEQLILLAEADEIFNDYSSRKVKGQFLQCLNILKIKKKKKIIYFSFNITKGLFSYGY